MAHRKLVAFGMIAALPLLAASREAPGTPAPSGGPDTKYCLRVEPNIGSRMETVQCRTRADWASLEVDVDQEWAENGVRVIGA